MVFTHATRVRVPDGEFLPFPFVRAHFWSKRCITRIKHGMSRLAQLVERKTLNLVVVGSSPTVGERFFFILFGKKFQNENSPSGTRTRVAWVKTMYPDQLD